MNILQQYISCILPLNVHCPCPHPGPHPSLFCIGPSPQQFVSQDIFQVHGIVPVCVHGLECLKWGLHLLLHSQSLGNKAFSSFLSHLLTASFHPWPANMWVSIYKPWEPNYRDTLSFPIMSCQHPIFLVICLMAPYHPHGVSMPALHELHIPYAVQPGHYHYIFHLVHVPHTK